MNRGARFDAEFTVINQVSAINKEKIEMLREFADRKYHTIPIEKRLANDDLKIALSRSELEAIVGNEAVKELEATFGEKYDEILIRRC